MPANGRRDLIRRLKVKLICAHLPTGNSEQLVDQSKQHVHQNAHPLVWT